MIQVYGKFWNLERSEIHFLLFFIPTASYVSKAKNQNYFLTVVVIWQTSPLVPSGPSPPPPPPLLQQAVHAPHTCNYRNMPNVASIMFHAIVVLKWQKLCWHTCSGQRPICDVVTAMLQQTSLVS